MLGALVAAGAMLALTAASASAANRFASPTGTTAAPCTQALPCDIVTAVNKAAGGDNITIEPGTYGPLTTPLSDNGKPLSIHDLAGQPLPVIDTTADYGFDLSGGSKLSDVVIDDSRASAYGFYAGGPNASIDHVYVNASGSGAWACYPNATMVDSVCWASGPNGTAVTELIVASVMGELRNDTLIASGTGGHAIGVFGKGDATMTIDMTNTIAHGAAADIYATTDTNFGSKAVVNADHSNYASVTEVPGKGTITITPAGSGTNQDTAPVFADAAAGNFRELMGSPTIGAGVDSPVNGSTDLDGNPREIAGATDIGAYQFIPGPSCVPQNASTKFGTLAKLQLQCSFVLGGLLSYVITGGPQHGMASIAASTGAVTYTPAAGYSGTDSFTYSVTSMSQTTTTGTVTITVGKEPKPALSHVKHSKGTFSFRLNEAATVTLTFAHHGHAKGTIKLNGRAGANRLHFTGRLPHRKRLKHGKYTVTIKASNAGGVAKAKPLKFTLKS